MPINSSMLSSMEKSYGPKKGRAIYFAKENSGDSSFKKGLATAKREGHTAKNLAAYKKGRRKRSGRKRRT